jgi:hypothetical protein
MGPMNLAPPEHNRLTPAGTTRPAVERAGFGRLIGAITQARREA